MQSRAFPSLVLSIWLIVWGSPNFAHAERWSRQVSNSDWIPLASPRNQQAQSSLVHSQNLPSQVHQPLVPSSLPPELRQEYQQQLLQLQKTQESIQRILLLQQELKAQQQLLQSQGFLPNGAGQGEDNKQNVHQGSIPSGQSLPDLSSDVLVPPPQLVNENRPPLYSQQSFRDAQAQIAQEQYEEYGERPAEGLRNGERVRETLRDKDKYVETPSGAGNNEESGDDGQEEVQLLYVPAEVLAQHNLAKNQRNQPRRPFNQDSRPHHRPYQRPQSHQESNPEPPQTTPSAQEEAYARDFLQQLQREHEGTDRLLKEARQKELARLREERKEIARQAKLRQAQVEREQEVQRQREAEKKRKELAKLEESAKQRELQRLRDVREKQREEELEITRKAQARINEERRKEEEARAAEEERQAAQERQKKADLERTLKAQRELDRVRKAEEERAQRTLSRENESQRLRPGVRESSPQAESLVRTQLGSQGSQSHSGKLGGRHRLRSKPRQRVQHQQHVDTENVENFEENSQDRSSAGQLSPNQPPLAVYMINLRGDSRVIRVSDVLRTLKGAKTIDVLDNVGQDAPQVFVGPSNLEVPMDYAKFDLPYLSSIDNNRVERRVDKLPFFVAPLSFTPPAGYSKIPFPAPHIGSVVVNTLETGSGQEDTFEDLEKSNLNPLIEPNAFPDSSDGAVSYSTTFEPPTTSGFSSYRQEQPSSTPQYQSTPSYSHVESSGPASRFRFRQHFSPEQPSSSGPGQEQVNSRPSYQEPLQQRPYHEESTLLHPNDGPQYVEDTSRSTTPVYRRPGSSVSSFSYEERPQQVSTTPVYQDSYSQVREDSTLRRPSTQLSSDHDQGHQRQVGNRYQQEYSSETGVNNFEETLRGPTQYNLPAELPPILPQLPGLVNSLMEEGEQEAFVNKQQPITTTSTTTTTTTEAPTTHRPRSRHRGRIIATRPSTTTSTTLSPPTKYRDGDRPRRPISRSRSRFTTTFTTTTEEPKEYQDTYEPTKAKMAQTTPRYNAQESFKRPGSSKIHKFKARDPETGSRGHLRDSQSQGEDANDRSAVLDSNPRLPEVPQTHGNEGVFPEFGFGGSTSNGENYPVIDGDERRQPLAEIDYSKTPNYPQTVPVALGSVRNRDEVVSQQYQDQFTPNQFGQPILDESGGFDYRVRGSQAPAGLPSGQNYPFYPGPQDSVVPKEGPENSNQRDYQDSGVFDKAQESGRVQNEDLTRPQAQFGVEEDKNLNFGVKDGQLYDPYVQDGQEAIGTPGVEAQLSQLEITTEPTTTTTTTTETAPLVIRQRVRGRLGGRGRPDAHVQTRPRGNQEEYVRFSAVNNQNSPTTARPTTRHRETPRPRTKNRHQYQGSVQVQTEGNDYVRIQAPIRTYQKTIVTPPSTTQRTTTTPAPTTTTTAQYEEVNNDGLEYGFIRPPNFNPVHPVDNRNQNFYRPVETQVDREFGVTGYQAIEREFKGDIVDFQAQLQLLAPADETAEDSNLSHTQVSRNRPKYQSPNRRPTNKHPTTTTSASDTLDYADKPRTRVEEPKNNRIRVRGRKPGRRRTTTTTTTTTEYVLEDTNGLPLEENYPRHSDLIQDPTIDRQGLYDENYEALPLAGATGSPLGQQSQDNSYTNQDFVLNFGTEPASPDPDQTQLASQPPQKYSQTFGSRSRTYSTIRGGQDRDIHSAESQWSTKLTSSSFQPSPAANRLGQDDLKSSKNKFPTGESSADAPEIITAAPDDSFVTVLVTSDDKEAKSMSADSMDAELMQNSDFGMKTNVVNAETTTPTSTRMQKEAGTVSTEALTSLGTEKPETVVSQDVPTRRAGQRRRRVRVRVRPAPVDDFVTAESQHFNSAVNSLLQDRIKFNQFDNDDVKKVGTTVEPTVPTTVPAFTTTETPEKTILEDFLDEMFIGDSKSTEKPELLELSTMGQSEDVTTSLKTETEGLSEVPETSTVTMTAETMTVPTVPTVPTAPNMSGITAEEPFSTLNPATTTTDHPSDAWDTKQYDSVLQNGEFSSMSHYPDTSGFEDNLTGQGNEVFQNDDYGQKIPEVSQVENETDDENYPKNHRSEWSEVRYPTARGLYNYNQKVNLTATQLPGVVSNKEADGKVKTLSDYVKAIFDTMKTTDEDKEGQDVSLSTISSEGVQNEATSSVPTAQELTLKDESTVTSGTTVPTVLPVSWTSEAALILNGSKKFGQVGNFENTEGFSGTGALGHQGDEPTGQPEDSEMVETTRTEELSTPMAAQVVNLTTGPGTEAETSTIMATGTPQSSSSSATSVPEASTMTENSRIVTSSKLAGILRTSTSTKVSHMTEICYRGRCVMTKPKKEFQERR